MPVLVALVISTIIATFGIGYYHGYSGEHQEVLALQSDLNRINSDSQKLLNDTQKHNEQLAIQQQETINELEEKYHETITNNDGLHDRLLAAQLQYRERNKTISGCTMSQVGNSPRSQKDDDRRRPETRMDGFGLSERFDSFVSRKARDADKIDADRRLLLDWIKSIPPELIEDR